MIMKALDIMSAAVMLLLAAACGLKKSEFAAQEELIGASIKEKLEGVEKVSFGSMAVIDSSTYRQEIERRKATFELKVNQELKLLDKYNKEGKKKNAAYKTLDLRNDARIIKSIDSLAAAMGADIDKVAFYDYEFDAILSGKEIKNSVQHGYAAITPDGELLGINPDRKALHKSTGKVIPGYLSVIKDE